MRYQRLTTVPWPNAGLYMKSNMYQNCNKHQHISRYRKFSIKTTLFRVFMYCCVQGDRDNWEVWHCSRLQRVTFEQACRPERNLMEHIERHTYTMCNTHIGHQVWTKMDSRRCYCLEGKGSLLFDNSRGLMLIIYQCFDRHPRLVSTFISALIQFMTSQWTNQPGGMR